MFRSLDHLLRHPNESDTLNPFALLIGAIFCYVMYGVAAGFFQGGWGLGLAVMKIPLIILGSLALCIPSLYVFTALSGADYSPRSFTSAIAGFCGVAGLLLLALMPVIWLFSVSTISLSFVVWLHVTVWVVTLFFAHRFLARTAPGARGAIGVWLVLLFFVSLQMTTYVRPVLWRGANEPLFATEKKSFFGHLGEVARWKINPPASDAASVPAEPR
ncbi:MAG TPA: hypothetical protein VGQ36_14310 [Thermoanaerobaculia bacterium]|nr:hypothetical protein [Thermoanaerobaculia bacterium]